MRSTAFSPGHITGFFQVCEHEDPLRTGSRGAGVCVSMGATSHVMAARGDGRMKVKINRERDQAPVTRQALAELLDGSNLDITVETYLELPMSQGFGMSAAGALSAALALAEILGRSREEAIKATHRAEVIHRCGLGDVAGISIGGVNIRTVEGVAPYGRAKRIAKDLELVVAVMGSALPTASVLFNRGLRRAIDLTGAECVDSLVKSPSLANFLRLSREFSEITGLMTDEVELGLRTVDDLGLSSMIMLGNSIFVTGDLEEAERRLSPMGEVHRVRADWHGPRILDSDR
jgi:pantoate kinase